MFQDLKFAIRTLARRRWSTVITILSLSLGIGVNTALVTAYNAFFARPLDARNADEMVNIAVTRRSGVTDYEFSYADYEAYRDSTTSFSGLAAFRVARVQLTASAGKAEPAQTLVVSDNYFEVLGISPRHGRTFEAAEPEVLISENFWQRRFNGDPAIVGTTVQLNGVAVTIVGVTPRDFVGTFIAAPAFWIPISMDPRMNGDSRPYRIFGRLAAGASMAQAATQMTSVADRLWTPSDARAESSRRPAAALVWPGSPFPYPPSRLPGLSLAIGLVLFGAAMLLAVACANVGSLQLASARARDGELRTRVSLGATRARLIRQLLTESALMGLAAGALALLFTWALLKVGVRAVSEVLPLNYATLVFDVSPNLAIFAYVLLISLTAGVLSGLSSAIQSQRSALASVGRSTTVSLRGRRLQGILVATQVALSLVLLITGTMFVRGAMNSLAIATGYDTKKVVRLDFQFPRDPKYTEERRIAVANEIRVRIAALPGVTAVTSARAPGNAFRTAASANTVQSMLYYSFVQPGYFETLGIPIVRGRGFEGEIATGRYAVLSESATRRLFGNENPVGRDVRLGSLDEDERLSFGRETPAGPIYQIAGIARDTRGFSFDGSDSEQIYLPLAADRIADRPLLIRVQGDPLSTIRPAERAIAGIDPEIVVTTSTLDDALRQSGPFVGSTLAAAIASSIGTLGLLLALIGIFGTVSHVVALRTREVGIRMAIGAQRRDVLQLIFREIMRPVVAGLIAGMAIAAGLVYLLRGIFYGITVVDGSFFVAMSLVFFVIALVAAYPPARRAMKVDPVVALRCE